MDPDFLKASDLDESKYERVQLGKNKGEMMKIVNIFLAISLSLVLGLKNNKK